MKEKVLSIMYEITEGIYSREELISIDYEKERVLDSLQIVELVVELESAFDIEIADEDLSIDNLKSFEKIVLLVQKLIK